jgi:hypothetical protein
MPLRSRRGWTVSKASSRWRRSGPIGITWRLLKRRAALVRCKVQLDQSLGGLDVLQEEAEELVAHCEQMIRKLDRALLGEAKQLGWGEWIERCQGIPGVGPLTAMALVASWRRGEFHRTASRRPANDRAAKDHDKTSAEQLHAPVTEGSAAHSRGAFSGAC